MNTKNLLLLLLLSVKSFASCDQALVESLEDVSKHECTETANNLSLLLAEINRHKREGGVSPGPIYKKGLEIDQFSFNSKLSPDAMTTHRLKELLNVEERGGEESGWLTADLLEGAEAKKFLKAFRDSIQGKRNNFYFNEMKRSKPTWRRLSSRLIVDFLFRGLKAGGSVVGIVGGIGLTGYLINPNMDWRAWAIGAGLSGGVTTVQSAIFSKAHDKIRDALEDRYENARAKYLSFKKLAEEVKAIRIPEETREGLIEYLDPKSLGKEEGEYRWIEWTVSHHLRVTFIMSLNRFHDIFILRYFVWEKY